MEKHDFKYFLEVILVGVFTIVSASSWSYVLTHSLNLIKSTKTRMGFALFVAIMLTLSSIYIAHLAFYKDEKNEDDSK